MKHINKIPLRKLVHKKETYLWKRGHYHLEEFKHSKCAEKLIVYLEDYKNSPLHLHFKEEDNLILNPIEKHYWQVGYPESGIIWKASNSNQPIEEKGANYIEINLNHPKIIVKIIDFYLQYGWSPKTDKQVHKVENALSIIESIFSVQRKGDKNNK